MPSWRLALSLVKLQQQLDSKFPGRTKPDWTVGDAAHRATRSDHNPNSAGVVRAVDLRQGGEFDPQWLADRLTELRDLRVRYWIYDGRICVSRPYRGYEAWVPQPYGGRNPHRKHIHVSVQKDAARYDDNSDWRLEKAFMDEDFIDGKTGHILKTVARRLNIVLAGKGVPKIPVNGRLSEELLIGIEAFNRSYGFLPNNNTLTVRAAILLGLR